MADYFDMHVACVRLDEMAAAFMRKEMWCGTKGGARIGRIRRARRRLDERMEALLADQCSTDGGER